MEPFMVKYILFRKIKLPDSVVAFFLLLLNCLRNLIWHKLKSVTPGNSSCIIRSMMDLVIVHICVPSCVYLLGCLHTCCVEKFDYLNQSGYQYVPVVCRTLWNSQLIGGWIKNKWRLEHILQGVTAVNNLTDLSLVFHWL